MDRKFQFINKQSIDPHSPIPLYHQIYQQLKRELMLGSYKAGERFFSYRKLKDIYGAELRTIAEAVNLLIREGFLENRPQSGTYVCNLDDAIKKGVFVGNFWYILLGNESFEHPFYFRLLKGIERRIDKTGLKLIVGLKHSKEELLSWFTPNPGDGMIITGDIDDPELLEEISRRADGRLVVAGLYKNIDKFPSISVDIERGLLQALEMTKNLKIRSLGIIAGAKEWYSNRVMLKIAKTYAENNNLDFCSECLDLNEDGYKAMRTIHQNSFYLPDCLLITDPAYAGACHYIMRNNIRCPEKLKIIRYGMNPAKNHDYFSSINVYSETESMGAAAVEMLLSGKRGKTLFPLKIEMNDIFQKL